MTVEWADVDHVTKVDPAKELPDRLEVLEYTDLVMVGGSDDVTEANTLETVRAIDDAYPDLPVLQEPYDADQVTTDTVDAVDYLAIPAIYNGDMDHFVGKHLGMFENLATAPGEALGASLPIVGSVVRSKGRAAVESVTDKLLPEGYVIQNPDSAAADVTGADEPVPTDRVAGAALANETYYGFPIFYVEYSGTYGGPEDVAAAAQQLEETTLLYGGGIDGREKAEEILDAGADAIVVGDCFHDDVERFLETTPGGR